MSSTSKLITYIIGSFTSGMKSQLIVYLLSESEHMYLILGLDVDVHSMWVLWTRWPSKNATTSFFLSQEG